MTLIKSISGIRGTIGGEPGKNLTPVDIVNFTSAFGYFQQKKQNKKQLTFVIGRDARISGEIISGLVCSTLQSLGINVIDVGLSTTPTVEMAVISLNADGGIIITASHNPMEWNALKLLNEKGEFISAKDGEEMLTLIEKSEFSFATIDHLGLYTFYANSIENHIKEILALDLVDKKAIAQAHFRIAVDVVNSTGGLAVVPLLESLGVKHITIINGEPTGYFNHNPEPIPENLHQLSSLLSSQQFDVGFAVDPDVDRLAIVTEKGEFFGEEYTLVAIADYILQHTKGNTVSNLSSSRALRDISEKYGVTYAASAVGEVNVVKMMKETNAVIGGEGNGGIIYPALHYGRDALVGIALFLSYLAKSKKSCSALRSSFPSYFIFKNKINLSDNIDSSTILNFIKEKYKNEKITTTDGVKIDFEESWLHIRTSNTEPIIRIYTESTTETKAVELSQSIIEEIQSFIAQS